MFCSGLPLGSGVEEEEEDDDDDETTTTKAATTTMKTDNVARAN